MKKKTAKNKKNEASGFNIKTLEKNWVLVTSIILALILLFQYSSLLSGFNSLPGPLYGGDIYMYEGMLNHHYKGGSFFSSSQFYNEYTHYPQLYFLIASLFGKTFGLDSTAAGIFYPLFIFVISAIIIFWFSIKFFKDKSLAALFSIFWLTLFQPSLSPTRFNIFVAIPLIYLVYFYYKDEKKYWVAGIILGLSSLIELSSFMHLNLLLVLLFLYEVLFNKFSIKNKVLKFNKKDISKDFKINFIRFLKIYLVALPFFGLFFGPIIFTYKFNILNPIQEFVSKGTSAGVVLKGLWNEIRGALFTFRNVYYSLISLLTIVGVYSLFKKKMFERKLVIFMILVLFLGYIHPLFTLGILGISFAYWSFGFSTVLIKHLIAFLGFNYLTSLTNINYKKYLYLVFLCFVLFSLIFNFNAYANNQWTLQAENPQTQVYELLTDSLNQYVGVNDVVLTLHPESSFAVNALTGAKTVSYRRTHANSFVEQNERIADSAIMLFSNNTELVNSLKQKYSVDYLFIEPYGIQATNTCLQGWDAFDANPDASYSCLTTSLEYKDYLESNGFETKILKVRLDPASNEAPRFDMLIIKPKTFIYGLETSQMMTLGNGLDESYRLVKFN